MGKKSTTKNCVPAYPLSSFENRHFHQRRPHAKSCVPLRDLLHVVNSIQQILGRLALRILGFTDKKCCNMEHVYSCIKIFIGGGKKVPVSREWPGHQVLLVLTDFFPPFPETTLLAGQAGGHPSGCPHRAGLILSKKILNLAIL